MRDASLQGWIADLDHKLSGSASVRYLYDNVMDPQEAKAIERASTLAFMGRFGDAEAQRVRADYGGLGLVDDGAMAAESEDVRRRFQILKESGEL